MQPTCPRKNINPIKFIPNLLTFTIFNGIYRLMNLQLKTTKPIVITGKNVIGTGL
jgi:hypothetical protein